MKTLQLKMAQNVKKLGLHNWASSLKNKKTQIGNNNDCCITALVLMTGGMRLFLGG